MSKKRTGKSNFKKLFLFVPIILIIAISTYFILNKFNKNSKDNGDQVGPTASETPLDEKNEELTPVPVVDLADYMTVDEVSTAVFSKYQPIKGLYVTGNSAGIPSRLDGLIELADTTEINAFVIDVKNDSGYVTFDVDLPLVNEIGAENYAISDINEVMDKLYDHGIYPIARIVVFKDPLLSSAKTDYAIKNKDGSLFQYKGFSWVNPYYKPGWEYVIDVAKEAAKVGFKEIQFDYIRFEATQSLENADFGHIDTSIDRKQIILDFLDYANAELKPYNVKISADVFGTIITSEVDAKMIGQNYVEMSKRLDIVCPMVYPSHYGRGYFGLPASAPPDLYPYEIIFGSMSDSNRVLSVLTPEEAPIVRPWLQAFTASYLPAGEYMTYGADAIRKQIQATYDAGLTEWILWNPSNKYGEGLELEAELQ